MTIPFQQSTARAALLAFIAITLTHKAACTSPGNGVGKGAETASPNTPILHVLTYAPGPAWKPNEPVQNQDLADHLGYVGELFAAEQLIGNGLLTSQPQGVYLFNVQDEEAFDNIVARDPATQQGVLEEAGRAQWLVLLNGFDEVKEGHSYFILRYKPGAAWQPGLPLAEQVLAPHLGYMEELFGAGALVAGGPIIGRDRGMYILALEDESAVHDLIAADPGVASGLFAVEMQQWQPFQLQALGPRPAVE